EIPDRPPFAGDTPKSTAKNPSAGATWWFEGDDLILVEGPTRVEAAGMTKPGEAKQDTASTLPLRVADVLDTIEGKQPSVAAHPGRNAALAEGNDIPGFEANGLFFVEVGECRGLFAGLKEGIGAWNQPYIGMTLPEGKYMHDDVRYFAPGPAFP